MKRAIKIVTVIMEWIFSMILLLSLSFIYYLNIGLETKSVIYIPKGSISKIITHLSADIDQLSTIDRYALRVFGSPQHGWIEIGRTELSHADFLYAITHHRAATQEITLIPGETTYIFLDQLSSSLDLNRTLLQRAFDQSGGAEGRFVPDTYQIPLGINELEVVELLLDRSHRQMLKYSKELFGHYNREEWLRLVTYASIVQKESGSIDEMSIVSSVIANRLRKGMKLQMDGSLNYGKYSHIKITARRLREDKSRYNTYLYSGLPPYPVCNVSFDALKAARYPDSTDYLYFVKGSDGKHKFARYYSTHKRNIKDATK